MGSNSGEDFDGRHVDERGWIMVNICYLCKVSEESIDHILIHCDNNKVLSTLFLSTIGMVWVFPNSVKNLLLKWKFIGLKKEKRVVCHLNSVCLSWCIWEECN